MLKAKINNALYCRVELTDVNNDKFVGWLIQSPYNNRHYMILPIDKVNSATGFTARAIKSIKHLSNGVVLK